jgi:hypothetical protein
VCPCSAVASASTLAQRLELGPDEVGSGQVGLVQHHQRADTGRRRGGEVAIDDEQVRRGCRRDHRDQPRQVGDDRLGAAAQVGPIKRAGTRLHGDDTSLAVLGVVLALHAVAADDVESPSLRACIERGAIGHAHDRLATESGNDLGIESWRHVAQ